MSQVQARPPIASIDNAAELRQWYWLKSELVAEARRLGLKVSGAKFTLLERLCHFHVTGEREWSGDEAPVSVSRFDWGSARLSPETVVTDNYKNTQNVRRYFIEHIDPGFKFNIELIDWFRANVGKTLQDAGEYWREIKRADTDTVIKPHNQFNQYTRDFIADNPEVGMQQARRFWALKKALPSKTGRHHYERSDLNLSDED